MAKELPTDRARSRLRKIKFNPRESVVEFYAHLIQIDTEAARLRQNIASTDLDPTGFSRWRDLQRFESKYVDLHSDLLSARQAIIRHEPWKFERVEANFDTDGPNDLIPYRNQITKKLNSAFDELSRTREVLTAKQNAAMTRMSLTISTSAVLISALSLLISAIGLPNIY